MTLLIELDGKALVYGLTWVTVCGGKKESDEVAALTREAGTKWYARYGGAVVKVGMVNADVDVQQKTGADWQQGQSSRDVYSAALLFSHYTAALAPDTNSLLIHQLDEKRVAMITLLKGVPYLDFVAEAVNLEAQLGAIQNEVHANLVIYVNRAGASGQMLTAHTLLSGATDSAALKMVVRRWRKTKRLGWSAALLALCAAGGAWKFAGLENRFTTQNKEVDPVVAYEENVRRLLAGAGLNGAAAHRGIWEIVKVREIESDGWSLKSIKCKPTQCEELWQKGHGNFSSFKRNIHAPQTVALAANGLSSVVNYPLAAQPSVLDRATLPTKAEAWAELIARQQRLRQIHPMLVLQVKNPELRGLEPPLVAGSIPPPAQIYAGELTLSAPLGLAADLLTLQMENILINEVLIEALGDVRNAKIQIKGFYYAKN